MRCIITYNVALGSFFFAWIEGSSVKYILIVILVHQACYYCYEGCIAPERAYYFVFIGNKRAQKVQKTTFSVGAGAGYVLRKASVARVNRRLRRYYLIVRLLPNVFALACRS